MSEESRLVSLGRGRDELLSGRSGGRLEASTEQERGGCCHWLGSAGFIFPLAVVDIAGSSWILDFKLRCNRQAVRARDESGVALVAEALGK